MSTDRLETIQIPVTLYSVPQALVFLGKLGVHLSDTWLRKRMRDENLRIHQVGRTDFVTETDLYKLSLAVQSKPMRKRRKRE
ncbi:MAG: hypothetical protein A2147_07045 [Chloroflexi bacterium RBG_16_57_8]|nr:MAG: hypothetical protein A2147_07045 [Chloroflexi bacterium RBG_16_57_8]